MKLHQLRYSPYVAKVRMVLDLLGLRYAAVDVNYGDRSDLVAVTGGYVSVPVLELDDGRVIVDSRAIVAHLLEHHARPGVDLVPAGDEALQWGFHDHVEGPIEDVLFRIATPGIRDAWATPWERALYVFVKERRYGPGCVDAWEAGRADLMAKAATALAPVTATLARRPFVQGDRVTLADCALYGQWVMLEAGAPGALAALGDSLPRHLRRMEALVGTDLSGAGRAPAAG